MTRFIACASLLALSAPALAQDQVPAADPTPAEVAAGDLGPDPALADTDAPLAPAGPTPGDPFERFNRGVWGLNQGLDRIVIKPVTQVYRFVTPRPARRGIHAIFANLSEPWSFINNLLQGRPGRAANNLGRFVINTTLGVGGLADHATALGIAPAPEDFGQTLGAWGIRSSSYLVLPLLGPSTVRDGVGTGVAMFGDPYRICLDRCTGLSWTEQMGINAVQVVDIRTQLTESGADAFLESSLDPYAAARSAYLQQRDADIANASGDEVEPQPGTLDPTVPTPSPEAGSAPADPAAVEPVDAMSAPDTSAAPLDGASQPDF